MASTNLIGLLLPATGTLSGQWGGAVNNAISQVVDAAVAGTQTISTDADITLTVTEGAYDSTGLIGTSAQYAVIRWTANGSVTRNITVPAQSKTYVVINDTAGTQSIVIRGAGPTTGVTVAAGERTIVAWTGSDFESVGGGSAAGADTQLQFNDGGAFGASSGMTWDGTTLTATGFGGPINGTVGATTPASGEFTTVTASTAIGVASGGTGATTLTANNVLLGNGTSALQAVAPSTSGNVLTSNGTTWTSALPAAGGLEYVTKTANYTTIDKEGVLADTSGGAFTVTLPASPDTGAQVVVADPTSNWGTNNLTIGRNGSTISGAAEDLVCDIDSVSVQLVYDGTTWVVYAQVGGNGGTAVTLTGTQTLTNKTITNIINDGSITEEVYALTGTDLDPDNGTIQTKTLTTNTTFAESVAAGQSLVLMLTGGASYTVTWPTMTWVTSGGNVAPTLTANDTLVFWKVGSTLYGAYVGSYV